jgi:hypothetical protein
MKYQYQAFRSIRLNSILTAPSVALGGLVVAILSLDPTFVGSNPDEDDGFLRAIKIRSTTFFGGEVKPLVPCRKVFRYVKENYEYEIDTL